MIRGKAPIWPGLSQTSHLEDCKEAGACLAGLLAIHGQYMSEFMKTVSSLKQNFFACLPAIAGREASPVLEKPGGLPSRRVGGDSLVVWLPVDTKQGGAALPPGGWGGSLKRAFSSVKRLIFVAGELWPGIDLQDESPNTSRPDTRMGGVVSNRH